MPPVPWVRHDPATTRPLVANDIPLLRPAGKAAVEKNYPMFSKPMTHEEFLSDLQGGKPAA